MNGYSTFWQIAAMFLQLFRVCMNVFGIGPLFYRFSEFVLRDPFGLQMFGYNSDSMLLCFRKSNEGDTTADPHGKMAGWLRGRLRCRRLLVTFGLEFRFKSKHPTEPGRLLETFKL